jgi:hypothetical protein
MLRISNAGALTFSILTFYYLEVRIIMLPGRRCLFSIYKRSGYYNLRYIIIFDNSSKESCSQFLITQIPKSPKIKMDAPRYHSSLSDASLLGHPLEFKFSGRTAKNRFMKAAMSEKLSSWDAVDIKRRGIPSEKLAKVYKLWGEGGFRSRQHHNQVRPSRRKRRYDYSSRC